ncbi:MAG: glycosyltransferase [Solirubrobacteraceae bacterium]
MTRSGSHRRLRRRDERRERLCASRREEALACGLPIVVTDIPVQNRLIGGLPGVRSVAAEPEALAAGLRQMLALTERERDRHVAVARERFASFFSLDAWARRLIDMYEASVPTRS